MWSSFTSIFGAFGYHFGSFWAFSPLRLIFCFRTRAHLPNCRGNSSGWAAGRWENTCKLPLQGPAAAQPVPKAGKPDWQQQWQQWATQQHSEGFFSVSASSTRLIDEDSLEFSTVAPTFSDLCKAFAEMEWKRAAANISIVVAKMGIVQDFFFFFFLQDFAKASQLGLWSGPGGAKASQLWSGKNSEEQQLLNLPLGNSQLWSGLRPYSVFNNESCESLNSSTARLAIVIVILVFVIIIGQS